jgi:hypothetical protein
MIDCKLVAFNKEGAGWVVTIEFFDDAPVPVIAPVQKKRLVSSRTEFKALLAAAWDAVEAEYNSRAVPLAIAEEVIVEVRNER